VISNQELNVRLQLREVQDKPTKGAVTNEASSLRQINTQKSHPPSQHEPSPPGPLSATTVLNVSMESDRGFRKSIKKPPHNAATTDAIFYRE